jgi:hypothetical protein
VRPGDARGDGMGPPDPERSPWDSPAQVPADRQRTLPARLSGRRRRRSSSRTAATRWSITPYTSTPERRSCRSAWSSGSGPEHAVPRSRNAAVDTAPWFPRWPCCADLAAGSRGGRRRSEERLWFGAAFLAGSTLVDRGFASFQWDVQPRASRGAASSWRDVVRG